MKHRDNDSKAAVGIYGATCVLGAEAITATIPEMMRLQCVARNAREVLHLSSLVY
jgi:hypothetical protein